MSVFNNINSVKLDSFIESCKNTSHPVLLKDIKSDDTAAKSIACVRYLVDWQNNLDQIKEDPNSEFIFDDTKFTQFFTSQKALNKLKKQFSRLVVENLTSSQLESLIEGLDETHGFPIQGSAAAVYLFENHGEDALCLNILGKFANHPLKSPVVPLSNRIHVLERAHDDVEQDLPDMRYIFAVASSVEHFPFASNTWGFYGQPSFATFTPAKDIAVDDRRENLRAENLDKNHTKFFEKSPWHRCVEISTFAFTIQSAKFDKGSNIGNCAERSRFVFRKIVQQRQLGDFISLCKIEGGLDHNFIIARDPNDHKQFDLLESWNGAEIYSTKQINQRLFGYTGYNEAKGCPNLEKFDRAKHKIMVKTYNIYPYEQFKNVSKTKHPDLLQLLNKFHKIPNQNRNEKMLMALEIVRFIENKMPMAEYTDPAVQELYDQMIYLTKKERKKGLTLPPEDNKDLCLINKALKNLDLTTVNRLLGENKEMDSVTIFHAIKASLLTNNIQFLKAVVDAKVPIKPTLITAPFGLLGPKKALMEFAKQLSKDNGALDFTDLCQKAAS